MRICSEKNGVGRGLTQYATYNMKILVYGSKGFVASHLIDRLLYIGHAVYLFDRDSSFPKYKVDVVFHLATSSSIPAIIKNPLLAQENIDATFKILEWMRKTKTKKMVFVSSREVYSRENMHGVSKLICEALITSYAIFYGIKYSIVRMTNIYGRGDHEDRFIPTVIRLAKQDKPISVFGDRKINFVYIDDCVQALIESIKLEGIYDLNSSKSVKLIDVAKKVISLLGSRSNIKIKQPREGAKLNYEARPTPFKIKYSLEEGLKQIC